jgi:hypothetical protein
MVIFFPFQKQSENMSCFISFLRQGSCTFYTFAKAYSHSVEFFLKLCFNYVSTKYMNTLNIFSLKRNPLLTEDSFKAIHPTNEEHE